MEPALIACLRSSPHARTIDDVADWWSHWKSVSATWSSPASMAVATGFAADRVGWAFAGGYQAALRALIPALPRETLAALCVTEAEGNRPRHIRTTIVQQPNGKLRIDGSKRWTTLGPASTEILVVGQMSSPSSSSHPTLRVVRVPVPAQGLTLQPMAATRFVPEVPHAQVSMEGVYVDAGALLPHDGFDAYVKPFRTIEDIHVTLAVLAYLVREARERQWPAAFKEDVFAALTLVFDLADKDAGADGTHIALAGALRLAHRLYADASTLWATAGKDPGALRWRRDCALFEVAAAARQQRAVRAWERIEGASSADR